MSMSIKHFLLLALLVMLQACGGGSSKTPDTGGNPVPSSSLSSPLSSSLGSGPLSSASSSSISLSSNSSTSSSLSSSSVPNDLPVGTVAALPVLNLNTDNAAEINSRETYVKGNFSLSAEGVADVSGTLEVRGRGNSTWDFPKKPYRLKLTNSTALLGMPKGKNWVLLANYADKTLIRNDIAFMFSRSLGFEWTPRSQHVELRLNGVYQGVYQLVEHIRVDANRVNIDELKIDDIGSDKITGGYLMEVDFRMSKSFCFYGNPDPSCANSVNGSNPQREVEFCLDSDHGMEPACLASPETLLDPLWVNQRNYIQTYYANAEAALFGANFKDPVLGYAAYFDVDSVVNYYIENELFKNIDGASASFFLYKKRGGKFFFGPIWDFDLAMGNAGYAGASDPEKWHIRNAPWFAQFFKDPAFEAKVKARWKTLKDEGKIDYIFQYAQARATWLDAQQKKNYELWSITDVVEWIMHGTHGGTGSYEAEVKELIRWQRERTNWIDSQLSQ
ncbi:MAG: CotH kinase family protein [Cellvibrio sp.]